VPLAPPAASAPDRWPALKDRAAPARAALLGLLVLATAGACAGGGDAGPTTAASADAAETPSSAASTQEPVGTTAPSSVPPATSIGSTAATEPTAVTPDGFTTVSIEVTDAAGEVCEVCVWLADSSAERGRGLMGVTDLAGAAGMLFAFERPGEHTFYMLGTPTPLSIAWFDDEGAFVSDTDMDPCLDLPAAECPRYPPGAPVRWALETVRGGLEPLGIGEGATVRVIDGTEADRCP